MSIADHLASAPAEDPHTSPLLALLLKGRGLSLGDWPTLMEIVLKLTMQLTCRGRWRTCTPRKTERRPRQVQRLVRPQLSRMSPVAQRLAKGLPLVLSSDQIRRFAHIANLWGRALRPRAFGWAS